MDDIEKIIAYKKTCACHLTLDMKVIDSLRHTHDLSSYKTGTRKWSKADVEIREVNFTPCLPAYWRNG